MKTKALFLLLLMSISFSCAEIKQASRPMKVGTIDLIGRVCHNCQYSLRQGYLTKVIEPGEGVWDISDATVAVINGQMVKIDPKLGGGSVSDVIQQSIRTRALVNKRMSRY